MAKSLFLDNLREHHRDKDNISGADISGIAFDLLPSIVFNKDKEKLCYFINKDKERLYTSYFIGADWINENEQAYIYVEPKLNIGYNQTNYLEMLFTALKHSEITVDDTINLFEIKFEETPIEINQKQDLLTPLIVVQFLSIVKEIVRKGLKKSYYKVEHNLYGKVKGKVMIGATIKQNVFKNKPLNTWCSYDEFGLNGLENRLLKKALVFVQRYLPTYPHLNSEKYLEQSLGYIMPAFESVSEEVNINDIKNTKINAFYKEYSEGLKLAKLILKRFGYNITNTTNDKILTPPFWIDMSKLFELYVLGLLKDAGKDVEFQFSNANYGNPDYLLKSENIIIDAKYKTYYKESFKGQKQWKRDEIAKDIRQLSGYSRDFGVLEFFKLTAKDVLPIMVIYPRKGTENKITELNLIDQAEKSIEFAQYYKLAINLPLFPAMPPKQEEN